MIWLMTYLLWAAILLGVPAALSFAWLGRGTAFIRTTAMILFYAFICMVTPYLVEQRSHAEGWAIMGLLVIGGWAFAIGVGTALCGALLLWLGGRYRDAHHDMRPEEEAR